MAVLDRGEMRVLSQAHAVALSALAGQHNPSAGAALEDLVAALPDHHPMRFAVARFRQVDARRFPSVADLQAAGRALRHAVDLHLMPAPIGQERVDLNG